MIELHVTAEELEAGLDYIRRSPKDAGTIELIVRRPDVDRREVIDEGTLDPAAGLVGDSWKKRASSRTPDGSPHPDRQITLMNSRAADVIASGVHRWPLAGDQLFVDLDLGYENLPPGTELCVGSAILVVTAPPHTGCSKFAARFGTDALKFVNSPEGRRLNLRGINAKVIRSGYIRKGDSVHRSTQMETDLNL